MGNNEPQTRLVCLPNNRRRGENNVEQSAIVSYEERQSRRKRGRKVGVDGKREYFGGGGEFRERERGLFTVAGNIVN